MDKFVKKSVVFGLGFMILLYSINGIYTSTNGYISLNDVYKFKNVPYNLEIVNFGTSHGQRGIYYGENNSRAFNFALASQLFCYDYALLNQYSNHFKKECIVIIPVSYHSFYYNYTERTPEQEPRYYGILDHKYLSFTYQKYIQYEVFPVLSANGNLKFILYDKKILKNEWEYDVTGSNKQDIENEIAERIVFHFLESNSSNVRDIDPNSISDLERILVYCKSNGFTPIMITIPVTQEYRINIPNESVNNFYGITYNLSEKYNVTYIDYSTTTKISSNYSLFLDTDHLNLNGRKIFTKILISDLNEMGLLNNSKDVLTY